MFKDFVKVIEYYDGLYDWEAFAAYYSPSERQYFWCEDYGCSCNFPFEIVESVDDLYNGSKEDLLRAWNKFAKSSYFMENYERLEIGFRIREHN